MNRTTTFHKNSVIVPHYLVYYVTSINETIDNIASLIIRRRTNRDSTVLFSFILYESVNYSSLDYSASGCTFDSLSRRKEVSKRGKNTKRIWANCQAGPLKFVQKCLFHTEHPSLSKKFGKKDFYLILAELSKSLHLVLNVSFDEERLNINHYFKTELFKK